MKAILISLATIASGTYLVAIDKIGGELYVGAILGPILAGSVAAGAVVQALRP